MTKVAFTEVEKNDVFAAARRVLYNVPAYKVALMSSQAQEVLLKAVAVLAEFKLADVQVGYEQEQLRLRVLNQSTAVGLNLGGTDEPPSLITSQGDECAVWDAVQGTFGPAKNGTSATTVVASVVEVALNRLFSSRAR